MGHIAEDNNNIRYCLVAVDVLSRQLWAWPVKTKSANDMVVAMEEILDQMPNDPSSIYVDNGKEFSNWKVEKLLNERKIEKFTSKTSDQKVIFMFYMPN